MIWYIAVGSALGGVARYVLGGAVQTWSGSTLPIGTLAVNGLGSFAIGAVLGAAAHSQALGPEARAFATIGFCGGFTTFSTFSYEAVALMQDGRWRAFAAYVGASVLLCLVATVAGLAAGREVVAIYRGL